MLPLFLGRLTIIALAAFQLTCPSLTAAARSAPMPTTPDMADKGPAQPAALRAAVPSGETDGEAFEILGRGARRASPAQAAPIKGAVGFEVSKTRNGLQIPDAVVKPSGKATALAIMVSGDGGWQSLEQSIAQSLARRGIAVVGLDSFRYFWSRKDPAQVAADLAYLLDSYGTTLGTRHYAVIGFSFGADILPEVWPLMPRSTRHRVVLVSLLALGRYSDFEVTVATMLSLPTTGSRPLGPALAQLPRDRTQCIYGREEANNRRTSCTLPKLRQWDTVALDGGHVFNGDYEKAAAAIWRRMRPALRSGAPRLQRAPSPEQPASPAGAIPRTDH